MFPLIPKQRKSFSCGALWAFLYKKKKKSLCVLYIMSLKDSIASYVVRTLQLGLLRDKFTLFFFFSVFWFSYSGLKSVPHSQLHSSNFVFAGIKELISRDKGLSGWRAGFNLRCSSRQVQKWRHPTHQPPAAEGLRALSWMWTTSTERRTF